MSSLTSRDVIIAGTAFGRWSPETGEQILSLLERAERAERERDQAIALAEGDRARHNQERKAFVEQAEDAAALNAKLLAALEEAETFIEDDTCRHDHEKALTLVVVRAAIAEAKGGRP